ncbi:MAG: MBL fold metallo-hydrolase [Candidatus Roseilinea sp.]|nr:MAG: MBL fold metallo-hydrolase [Candidatus Roseilinea sp.]
MRGLNARISQGALRPIRGIDRRGTESAPDHANVAPMRECTRIRGSLRYSCQLADMNANPFSLRCGQACIHLLSDGTSYWDGGGTFGLVPRIRWMKLLPPDELNRVPQELRCVLIEADSKRILVDCGVGNKPNDLIATQYDVRRSNGTLIDDLARLGLRPADIDIVILTHLHGDHSGWTTVLSADTTQAVGEASRDRVPIPTFTNARYYVQRREYEDATHPNERTRNTYFAENFVPLMQHGVLTLLDGEAQITPSVRVVPTPGHTAGHQSVIIEPHSGGAASPPVFLIGDMAPFMIHFERLPWVTAYDVLPMVTIETKRRWQQWAFERRAVLVSCHDTRQPVGRLVRNDKGLFSVVPLEAGGAPE